VFVLWNLALCARLYVVLAGEPAFFLARRSPSVDVLALVAILSFLLPALVAAVVWLVGLPVRRLRTGALVVVVFALMAAIALPVCNRITVLPPWAVVLSGVALGAVAAVAYCRFAVTRLLVTILWPVLLLSPGLFLFGSSAFHIIKRTAAPPRWEVAVECRTPVVMIVFDEFCGTTLMGRRRQIDRIRYPNFAALADDGTWFRNATTMSSGTHQALPSLLSGRHPEVERPWPTYFQFPENLFTLLAGSHRPMVWEAGMYLCPNSQYGRHADDAGLADRLKWLLIDVAVLELHILLPPQWLVNLPDITGRSGNFLGQDPSWPDASRRRIETFREFVGCIESSQKPGLYFAHVMLPHVPWSYLPSGKGYPVPFADEWLADMNVSHYVIGLKRHSGKWCDDPWAVEQAYQRYLLQLQFTDKMLGELLGRLKQVGLYDDSLIVITSDHGLSFRTGDDRRAISETNFADVLSIPLLIKGPGQREGAVNDRNVQTADVLPTMLELLGIETPWRCDGHSAFDDDAPEPDVREIVCDDPWADRRTFDDAQFRRRRDESLGRMLSQFGTGEEPGRLLRIGPHGELIGRRVEDLTVQQAPFCRGELVGAGRLKNVDLDAARLPCYVGGRLLLDPDIPIPCHLTVAVNGTIRAVTRTYLIEGLEHAWTAMLGEEALVAGNNEVRVFVVSSSAEGLQLQPVSLE
jgi:hypothetical protein